MRSRPQRFSRWYVRHHEFIETSRAPIFVAMGCVAALLMANLLPEAYEAIQEMPVGLPGLWSATLHFVVLEILMNVFFLCAGKEIKDSITLEGGALRQGGIGFIVWITLGGVIVPVASFLLLASWFDPAVAVLSYAIMAAATDVVFAVVVGRFAFSNPERPDEDHPAVKTLLALAVLDDLIGVVLIGVFLSDIPSPAALIPIVVSIVLSVAVPFGIRRLFPRCPWYLYLVCGLPPLVIFTIYHVPSAIAMIGVVAGMPGPSKGERDLGWATPKELERNDPLDRMERWFGWPQAVILLLFAFMASGVTFTASSFGIGTLIVVIAVTGGKTVGVCLFGLFAAWLGHKLPGGVYLRHLPAIGTIAGIGFTVSLLVAELASMPQPYHTGAMLTLVSGAAATLIVRSVLKRYAATQG